MSPQQLTELGSKCASGANPQNNAPDLLKQSTAMLAARGSHDHKLVLSLSRLRQNAHLAVHCPHVQAPVESVLLLVLGFDDACRSQPWEASLPQAGPCQHGLVPTRGVQPKKKEICTQPTPLAGPGHCLRPLLMMGDDAAWYGDSCQSPKDLPCMAPDDSLFRYGP